MQLVDRDYEYWHVVLTSAEDGCSMAEVKDLKVLNCTLSCCAQKFKTAFVQYQSKDNEILRNELIDIALSCQKNIQRKNSMNQFSGILETSMKNSLKEIIENTEEIDTTIYKTAKTTSILKQLTSVLKWLIGNRESVDDRSFISENEGTQYSNLNKTVLRDSSNLDGSLLDDY